MGASASDVAAAPDTAAAAAEAERFERVLPSLASVASLVTVDEGAGGCQ